MKIVEPSQRRQSARVINEYKLNTRNGSAEFNATGTQGSQKRKTIDAFTVSDESDINPRASINQSDYSLLKSLVDRFVPQEVVSPQSSQMKGSMKEKQESSFNSVEE